MINFIWIFMFLLAVASALAQLFFYNNYDIFSKLTKAIFLNAGAAVEISIGLIGILSFWLGMLKIVERTGFAETISNKLTPLFKIIMKDIPDNSPAISCIVLNMAANFLGLDNAATPMGLKAMEELQKHNKKKDEASDAQILFMILNSSSVTLIPITIFMYRSEMGAKYPTDVFIPILLATTISTLFGFISVAIKQKIDLKNNFILKLLLFLIGITFCICTLFFSISYEKRLLISYNIGNLIIILLISYTLILALRNKINGYEAFIEGAKEGFSIAIKIIPYLVAMLVIIGVFRASGILDILINVIRNIVDFTGLDSSFVGALPTAFMKPLSGSGARAMMIESMQTHGADSFIAFCSSVIQGSTETTFYVLTVYFGAINISKIRYALKYALWADFAGILAAILLSYMFYSN